MTLHVLFTKEGIPGWIGTEPREGSEAVEDLTLEIGVIDGVEVDNTDFLDAGGSEIHADGRTKATSANAKDAGGTNLLLAREAHLWKNQVARITANLVVA